ncbi:glycosyltransferase family 2 protein [Gimesia panareensis]|uniref:glycosyltransferase family 2 protein n=1 Tax=Gimesia panareensis TaxID=2527978 RepID=UPI00118C8137|nr:glycosyltransferase [Gimesia panareensis]QDU51821.1 Hyaluronan synthase [Gimesia panareensis]
MRKENLISVVIPSYNHEQYIASTISSVLNQTCEHLELIVIDDGSHDQSLEVIGQFQDPRLQVCHQENAGAHAAINRGLEMAQGDFLTILNSDDLYEPERLEICLKRFAENPGLGLVSSWINVIDSEGIQLGVKRGWQNMEPWDLGDRECSFRKTGSFSLNLLSSNFVATTSNMVWKRSAYESVGGMRELRFVHDWDFLLRVAAQFPCEQIEQPLMSYRIHETNTIRSDYDWMMFEICWVIAANLHRFMGSQLLNKQDLSAVVSDLDMLYQSINFQGNEKLVWLMQNYLTHLSLQGHPNPEEELIHNRSIREYFISKIQKPSQRQLHTRFLSRFHSQLQRVRQWVC